MFQEEFEERLNSKLAETNNNDETSQKLYSQLPVNLNALAQEVAQNNLLWDIPVHNKIFSHRPVIGRLIVLGKRITKKILKWLVSTPFSQQREFNASSTRSINEVYRLIEKIIENSSYKTGKINDQLEHQNQKIIYLEHQNKLLHELVLQLKHDNDHSVSRWKEFDKMRSEESFPIDYVSFEDEFRGKAANIKQQQLEIYLPHIGDFKKIFDAGCGRGELLEGLLGRGFDVVGFDLNKQMVSLCEDKGLPVHYGDFVKHLSETIDNYDVIISLHVIEHLKPGVLLGFLKAAYKRLNPGGKLILETPNPECLYNLAYGFTIDLTHQSMIHSYTLKFILEEIGFKNIVVKHLAPVDESISLERLIQGEEAEAINRNVDRVNRLLYGYQNYAIVAEKVEE